MPAAHRSSSTLSSPTRGEIANAAARTSSRMQLSPPGHRSLAHATAVASTWSVVTVHLGSILLLRPAAGVHVSLSWMPRANTTTNAETRTAGANVASSPRYRSRNLQPAPDACGPSEVTHSGTGQTPIVTPDYRRRCRGVALYATALQRTTTTTSKIPPGHPSPKPHPTTRGHLNLHPGRLLRCVQCPSAFHVGCVPYGAGTINPSAVVCSLHGPQNGSTINVNWCMACSNGGELGCKGCPAAFRETCLGLQTTPEGAFVCPDCLDWKHPKYGDILWVKLGCYRWWPAQVCLPADVPTNIQALKHEPIGCFAVRFYGSQNYYWTNWHRVFHFEEGYSGSLSSSSKSVARLFEAALERARQAWEEQRKTREQCEKPAPFRIIRANRVESRSCHAFCCRTYEARLLMQP
ncbi:hypothetical protein HPB50_003908 [Hyalomma asiaticum]|uniref:Uncharacterized protein n=1 Tax=Hyalomma asiaticum TaxID=266040 RepID=A0ACB7TA92_HYAAI|nr:hypothetical protein HPB50_003908 [Hyalomma asiaticum]